MATDTPGFATDEPVETLGEALRVPKMHQGLIAKIEHRLIPVELKQSSKTVVVA
jgi:glyoxalase family protein